jgi:glycosyltransferase involved in cell wall biosynthesis
MIARNEAETIGRCLASTRRLVDETVVVDTGSTDATPALAHAFGARVLSHAWQGNFAVARNASLEACGGDWILVLDADEVLGGELVAEIRSFLRGPKRVGRLRIVSPFRQNGQELESHCHVSRLFPAGGHFAGRIHEQLISPFPRIDLAGVVWHDGYLKGGKSRRNLALLEQALKECPGDSYLLHQVAIEHAALGESDQACRNLEAALARLDGSESHAPNVVVDYLYALRNLKRIERACEVLGTHGARWPDFPDLHFAAGLILLESVRQDPGGRLQMLPQVEACFRRCIELGETTRYKSVRGTGSFLAWHNLGLLFETLDDEAAARRFYKVAADLGYAPAAERLRASTGGQVAS